MPSGPRPNPAGLTQGGEEDRGREGARVSMCGDGDPGQRSCHGARGTLPGSKRKKRLCGGAASRAGSRSARLCLLHSSGVVGVGGRARGASVGCAELG